jgi:hypothetical protein
MQRRPLLWLRLWPHPMVHRLQRNAIYCPCHKEGQNVGKKKAADGWEQVQRIPTKYLIKDCFFFLLNYWMWDHVTNP